MLLQTFIRKQLRLKAHTVTAIEESDAEMVVRIERLGSRRLRCSRCGRTCRRVHSRAAKPRSWRDLPLRKTRLVLRYRPRRVHCERCGVRAEALPWAEPWARVSWNTPITRAYYLKESLQLFFDYKQPKRAREHLERWMHSAMRSRLEPFKRLVKMLRSHLDGVLAWTRLRLSNGAVEGMNNKIKLVSHRAFGFRTVEHYVAAIYHCCARLPLPEES